MRKTALLCLFIGFLATSLKGQKDKVYTFKDGTKVSFQYLFDKSEETLPWRLSAGLKPQFLSYSSFSYSSFAFEYELNGAYQLGNKVQLTGRLGYTNPTDDGAESSLSQNSKAAVGAYFTFASKKGIKELDITVGGRDDMITKTTYLIKDVEVGKVRLWEGYIGFSQFNTPMLHDIFSGNLNLSPADSLIDFIRMTGFNLKTLELGISTRRLIRSYFRIGERFRSSTRDSRWTAKVLLPLQTSFSTDVFRRSAITGAISMESTDRNFYEDYLINTGFALEYDGFRTSSLGSKNFLYGLHFGLRYHPFISGLTDLGPMVQAYLGFSLGLTKNSAE